MNQKLMNKHLIYIENKYILNQENNKKKTHYGTNKSNTIY